MTFSRGLHAARAPAATKSSERSAVGGRAGCVGFGVDRTRHRAGRVRVGTFRGQLPKPRARLKLNDEVSIQVAIDVVLQLPHARSFTRSLHQPLERRGRRLSSLLGDAVEESRVVRMDVQQ
jgi:hypothetical protein